MTPGPPTLAQRILVIGPSNIGDAILASDVIAAISQAFAEAHVTLAVGARAKAVFAGDPRIHSLVDLDQFSTLRGRLRLCAALWGYRPQIVVDLRHTLYPLLLKPLSAWRYARQPPAHIAHMRERHLWKLRAQVPRMASTLNADDGGTLPRALWSSATDASKVETLWRRWQLDPAMPLVLICPGARSHLKRWTVEGFAQVADRLIAARRAHVIFAGEPDEEPIVHDIQGLMTQRAPSAVGLTTIRQLSLLMQRADLVITNDSAALHCASTVRVPTLALFGPTDAVKYGPTAPVTRTIRRTLFCSPCEQSLCRFDHECMRFISADDVFEAACALLDDGRQATAAARR
jgi:lipopolysaccharide heptosyltransferase II